MDSVNLTIVIPAHNAEEGIASLLDSILSIDELTVQVIVVDDCSSDATAEIVRGYAAEDARVLLLSHDTNRGAGIARNTGFPHAKGQFTLFFDDDDELHTGALVEAVRALERGGQDLALLKYRYRRAHSDSDQAMTHVDESIWAKVVGERKARRVTLDLFPALLSLTNYPWNRIMRTETYRRAGLRYGSTMVNNDILGHWYSLLFARQILLFNEVICTHIVLPGGSNLTNRSSRERLSLLDALDETYDLLRAHPELLRRYSHFYWEGASSVVSWADGKIAPSFKQEFAVRAREHFLRITIPEYNALVTRHSPALANRLTRRAIG